MPQEDLEKLISAANQAPSGSNNQIARWIIVRDLEVKTKLAELNRAGVESYLAPMIESPGSLSHQPEDKRRRMLEAVVWQKEHMHEIPALVIACIDFGTTPTPQMIAGGNGSIWPGIQKSTPCCKSSRTGRCTDDSGTERDRDKVAEVLNLPETMAAYCLIPVGYPLGNFGPVTRKPLSEILRYDTW